MEQRTQGILLKTNDVGEADQVVNVFSLDHGRMVFRARGAKRSKRRFAGLLESFSHHEIVFQPGRGGRWPILLRLEPIEMHTTLRGDLGAFSAASYAVELFLKLTKEGDANPRLFQLLSTFLTYSTQQPLSPKGLCRFHLRILTDLGFQPNWNHCMECGRLFGKESFFHFDLAQGGLLCQTCLPPQSRTTRPLRIATQRLLSQLQKQQSLNSLAVRPWNDALLLLNLRTDHLLHGPPQSRNFLYQMNASLPQDSNPHPS